MHVRILAGKLVKIGQRVLFEGGALTMLAVWVALILLALFARRVTRGETVTGFIWGTVFFIICYYQHRTIRVLQYVLQKFTTAAAALPAAPPEPPEPPQPHAKIIFAGEDWPVPIHLIMDMAKFIDERAIHGFVAYLEQHYENSTFNPEAVNVHVMSIAAQFGMVFEETEKHDS